MLSAEDPKVCFCNTCTEYHVVRDGACSECGEPGERDEEDECEHRLKQS